MQNRSQRDAKSVTIATGFLLGAGAFVLGSLVVWGADALVGVPGDVSRNLNRAVEVIAVIVLVAYVAKNRRR